MTGTITALFLFAFIHGSSAATILSEPGSSVMRRESKMVSMTPTGQMIQNEPQKPETLVNTQGELSPEDLTNLAAEFCDYDFPMGKDDSSNCSDASNHSLILEESMCVEAGVESGATTTHDSFKISQDWEGQRPKGCFKYECAEAANKVCYFYNGDGDWPTAPKGSPVCSRPKYLNGTKDTNGGCPTGYEVIQNEDSCAATANCLGYAAAAEFRIGTQNASKTLESPLGCFIHNGDGHVYFNKKGALHTGANEKGGTSVKGTNLCKVSKTVLWDASGTATEVAADAAATNASTTATAASTTATAASTTATAADAATAATATAAAAPAADASTAATPAPPPPGSLSEVEEDTQNMDAEDAQDSSSDNPCSNIGCNSNKCAWASGGVVSRLTAKKSCSNAKLLGSQEVTMIKDQAKVTTLKECMHQVQSSGTACSGFFEMHADTFACSCVPQGADCTETTNEKICRYQVLEE